VSLLSPFPSSFFFFFSAALAARCFFKSAFAFSFVDSSMISSHFSNSCIGWFCTLTILLAVPAVVASLFAQ
jgi:hypothetical protein